MDRVRLDSLLPAPGERHAPAILQRLAWGLLTAGFPLLDLGCAQLPPAAPVAAPSTRIVRAAGEDDSELPATLPEAPSAPATPPPAHVEQRKVLPITLDTVLRLAEEQNLQVAQARARVWEAYAEVDVAASSWLPNVYVGTAYYRHEGGIQNEQGNLIHSSFGALFGGLELSSRLDLREVVFQRVHAERRLWQQKGDLSRISSETLLDAANTYIDLLAARTGEAIALGMMKDLHELLERTQKLAAREPAARVDVYRIQADITGRQQIARKLRAQAVAASAKLVYLLGLDPCTELVPVDDRLVPIDLVDIGHPVCALVEQALTTGPGVRELEGLLALIHESMARAQGPGRFLPILETRMAEGVFGAGPGASSDWDNRWDLGLQARWNLTEFVTACNRRRVAQAKLEQAHLAYQDLRGKLTAGVQEARETIVSGREQIQLGQQQIDFALQAVRLSDERMRTIAGTSASEVLLSQQSLALARLNYLYAVRAYDRAQLQLLVLLGPGAVIGCRPPESDAQLPMAEGTGK